MKQTANNLTVRPFPAILAVLCLFCTMLPILLFRIGTHYERSFSDPQLQDQVFESLLDKYKDELRDAFRVYYRTDGEQHVECPPDLMPGGTNLLFVARDAQSGLLLLRNTMEITDRSRQTATFSSAFDLTVSYTVSLDMQVQTKSALVHVECILPKTLTVHDGFRAAQKLIRFGRLLQPYFWSLSVIGTALTLLFAGLFLRSAVRAGAASKGRITLFRELPPDLLLAAFLPSLVLLGRIGNTVWHALIAPQASAGENSVQDLLLLSLCCAGMFAVLLLCTGTAAYSLRRGGVRYTVSCLRYEHALFTRRTVPMLLVLQLVKASAFALEPFARLTPQLMIGLLLPEKIILLPVLYRCLREIRTVYADTEIYVQGDFSHTIASRRLYGSIRRHAQDVDALAQRISLSADEYIRSAQFKAELLTNLSHDIKTPLTSMINYAALLQDPTLDEQKRTHYLDVLYRHSQRMNRLVEDLTQVSDTQQGKIEVHPQRINLISALTQSAAGFDERLQKRGIALRFDVPDQPVFITADVRLLWRVTDNLMNNICKYALPGTEATIRVQTTENEATAEYINTPASPLHISGDALMERFVRADNSRHTEGSGLGLSIARSLLQVQNGTLRLETEPDRFTAIFSFALCADPSGEEANRSDA